MQLDLAPTPRCNVYVMKVIGTLSPSNDRKTEGKKKTSYHCVTVEANQASTIKIHMQITSLSWVWQATACLLFLPKRRSVNIRLNYIDIIISSLRAFMISKRVYLIERSSYLYSAKKFLFYSMWDVINILLYKHNVLVVSHEIVRSNEQTLPPYGAK